ncbi:hypothetical protein QQ054_07220 [Oscillatoria amoena NRMC-F 0135]|nr:hypothetical protein [Oscillatoria amoena NRMC-F 0135]
MANRPKLRTVQKYQPPWPLNKFPAHFAFNLGKEVVYLLATRGTPRLEGTDWEEIFARLVGAQWRPSNVGLDDIILEQTAWGAKTVKNKKPSTVAKVRLISGRNSVAFSFGEEKVKNVDPSKMGDKVLSIYNERVASVRKKFQHLRTVVLIKSDDLLELAAFEFDTIMYDPKAHWWQWNDRDNLEGYDKNGDRHVFTWQPHGSQFTIIEDVPDNRLAIRIKKPPVLDRNKVLTALKFDGSWIEVIS